MRISWNEVGSYFLTPLPHPNEIAEQLNDSFAEVESITQEGSDWILDVKILPDRPDAKNAEGFARELSAVTQIPTKEGVSVIADAMSAKVVIEFSAQKINEILGLSLSDEEITSFLNRVRVGIVKGNPCQAFIPPDRMDLNLIEDLADEVMRLYGVNKIPSVALTPSSDTQPTPLYDATDKVRLLLVQAGFTEIYGYSFSATGAREMEKSLASHKSFMRTNLLDNIKEKLTLNLQYNLFEQEPVKFFEIGSVFLEDREEVHLAVGIAYTKEKYVKEQLPDWLLEVKLPSFDGSLTSNIVEVPLETLLPALEKMETPDPTPYLHLDRTFKPFSLYPRIIRDIALFVPTGVTADAVVTVIRESAGPLLVEGPVKFDEYTKEGEERTSLAFRIAFQSHEKSLTDEEANTALSVIISALEKHPLWQVRK